MHNGQCGRNGLYALFTAFLIAQAVFLEKGIYNHQLRNPCLNRAELEGTLVGTAAQNDSGKLRGGGLLKTGHKNCPDSPLPGQFQNLQASSGRAGVGEQNNHTVGIHGCNRGDLHMRIRNSRKLAADRGKLMGTFRCHNHGAARADAQYRWRLLYHLHGPCDQLQIHQFHGLLDSINDHSSGFMHTSGKGIHRNWCLQGSGPRSGPPGQFDFESIETFQFQTAAKSGNGRFCSTTFIRKLGDRHKLHLRILHQHKVCHPALSGSKLIVGGTNALQNIHFLFVHSRVSF